MQARLNGWTMARGPDSSVGPGFKSGASIRIVPTPHITAAQYSTGNKKAAVRRSGEIPGMTNNKKARARLSGTSCERSARSVKSARVQFRGTHRPINNSAPVQHHSSDQRASDIRTRNVGRNRYGGPQLEKGHHVPCTLVLMLGKLIVVVTASSVAKLQHTSRACTL